jgi:site-specific DNA recombinase
MPGEESKNYMMSVQRRDVATWVERENHEIVESYSDPGGRSYTLARPVFQQLLADARAGKFALVAVGRYDRFSRIQGQAAVATYQLKQCGVKVISVTRPVPEGAVGTMMTNMYYFAAELELEYIRARLYTGKRERVRSGKLPPLPYPKYGYQFAGEKKERYVPHPVNADLVRRIFALYGSGQTLRSIANTFTKEGIPTPSQSVIADGYAYAGRQVGTYWHPITVRKILMDGAYVGRIVGFKTQYIETTRRLPITGEVVPVVRQIVRDEDDAERVPMGQRSARHWSARKSLPSRSNCLRPTRRQRPSI